MDTEIDLKSVIGLIRRQIRLILMTFFAIIAFAALFTYSMTPKFDADALVLVDTRNKDLLTSDGGYGNPGTDNARVESEVGILKSDQILMRTIQENNLVADPEFGVKLSIKDRLFEILRLPASEPSESQTLAGVLNRFSNSVSVKRNGLTYLITVSVRSENAQKAAKLANSLTDIYIREQVASKIAGALVSRNTLQARVDAAQGTIAENEKKLDSYINDNLSRVAESTGAGNLTALRGQLDQLSALKKEQSDRLNTLKQSFDARDFEKVSSVLGSAAIAELDRQRRQITNRLSDSGANAADAINLKTELAKLDDKISKSVTQEADDLKRKVEGTQKQADELREQLRTSVLQSNLPAEMLAEMYTLQQSAVNARSQYQGLLTRLQELDAQTVLQLPDSRIVSPALEPNSASFPPSNLIILAAAVLALGFGLALAVLREHFVGGFVNEDQVESVLRLPLSAIAPYEGGDSHSGEGKGGGTASAADMMAAAPLSRYAEAVRRMRIGIDKVNKSSTRFGDEEMATDRSGKGAVILLTSSLPSEGKSTTALALARAYALTGRRTLLIDCDLRKPSINRYLNLTPTHTFMDYLQDDVQNISLASLTVRDPLTALTVLPGGRRADVATDELVMSEKMTRILNSARRHFEYVIIDSPPVEPVVDALYLAKHADVIAFVVKWAATPQSVAKRSIHALREHKNPNAEIIAILNQQDSGKSGEYYSYSGYYSET